MALDFTKTQDFLRFSRKTRLCKRCVTHIYFICKCNILFFFYNSLLKEAKPLNVEAGPKDSNDSPKPTLSSNLPTDNISVEERQLLGRYGVWLLVGLCTPNQDTPVDILGRLISMLFHWFHVTAYSYDGKLFGSFSFFYFFVLYVNKFQVKLKVL